MKNLLQPVLLIILFFIPEINAQDGLLDTGFGTSGLVINYLSTNTSTKYDAAVQTDDKIVFVGDGQGSDQDFMIVRYNADGSPDNSFGTNGVLYVNIVSSGLDDANAVVIQPDGKIVVAGFTHYVDLTTRIVAVIRLNSDGSLDSTFDGDGIVTTDIVDDEFNNFDEFGQAVALQSDGKIVVAGTKYLDFNGTTDREIMVIRYNSDGSIDSTFNGNGIVLTNFTGGKDEANGVAVQSDGKILVTGRIQNSNFDLIVIRYNSDGSLDTGFSVDGYDVVNFGTGDDVGNAVVIQSDNKIVVAGTARGSNNNFALLRYNSDGTPDTGFDTDGIVTTDFNNSNDMANSVKLLADGKIIVAGRAGNNFALARYNNNGSLDTAFGTSGKTTTDFSGNTDIGYGVVIQSDGKIVVAGTTFNFTDGPGFAMARYSGSSAPLPVELTSFTANILKQGIELKWQTVSEVNNYGFEIQRSRKSEVGGQKSEVGSQKSEDGRNENPWEYIGFVKGAGNSNSQKEYSFIDKNLNNLNYLYRLKQIDNDGAINYSKIIEASFARPVQFVLLQNYPNPFNPTTNFEFRIADFGLVILKVFDPLGNEIETLVNERKEPGSYTVKWNADKAASGIYFYAIYVKSENSRKEISETKKMVLVK